MKFLEPFCALAAAALRIVALAALDAEMRTVRMGPGFEGAGPLPEPTPAAWLLDWVLVLSLFWLSIALAGPRPRLRAGLTAACALWLGTIYAVHQGPHTFWFL